MSEAVRAFVADRFAQQHGAMPCMDYGDWHVIHAPSEKPLAALAVRSAADEQLFLETYIAEPIEQAVSRALGRSIHRNAIAEIGCLAAAPTAAILQLWGDAAVRLVDQHEVAVATLTLPLRRMFARIGLPFIELLPADPGLLRSEMRERWGSYYEMQPIVCVGEIAEGLNALRAFSAGGRA